MNTLEFFNEEAVEAIDKYVVQGKTFLESEKDENSQINTVNRMDDLYTVYKMSNKDNAYSAEYAVDILKIYSRLTIFINFDRDGKIIITNSFKASAFDIEYNFVPLTIIELLCQELRLEEAFSIIEQHKEVK